MSTQFKSLREIFREAREAQAPPGPIISPLIADAPPPAEPACDGLARARFADRLECALERLLHEIAAEVVGRELLLCPAEIGAIVERLVQRYGLHRETPVHVHDADIAIGDVDASLGRRIRAAIDRALR